MKNIEKDVVIIGAGLTGLTLAYYLKKAGKNIMLVEQINRTGGVIHSVTEKGFCYEQGPSTGVLGTVEIAALFDDLKNVCTLETASKHVANKRYIWKKKQWEALPSGLLSAITTPLFTLYDKFRILGEPFRKKGGYPDESIADLVVRRLGKSFLNYAVDPFLSGVYAGDPQKLITRHALPKLYALENEYGGFVRGSLAKQKAAKRPENKNIKQPSREVFSLKNGLQSMTDALTVEIGMENMLLSCKNSKLACGNNDYTLSFENAMGEPTVIHAAKVVSTVGAYALPELLPFVEAELMDAISNTTYAPVIHVAAGYKQWTGIELDAFGGLVSSIDKRNVLGVLFPSAIFANRAPEGGAMLSVFLGGMKRPDIVAMTDDEIRKLLCDELRMTMKTTKDPDMIRIHRYQHAIAQYDVLSEKRFECIAAVEQKYPGLVLAGSMRNGIGMADRVKQAKMIAEQLLNE